MEPTLDSAASSGLSAKTPQPREASRCLGDETDARATANARTDALIESAKAGDQAALATLLAEARPRALAVALKVLRNPDDAEDAVQEAFLKAWRYLGRFERRSSFSTWIHRIVMNASVDQLRRQGCRPEAHVETDESGEQRPIEMVCEETPERAFDRAQTSALVQTAMSTLSASHRQALSLRELEGRSYDEIAEAVHCPIGTVMSRLHHARRKLSDELHTTFAATELRAA